MKRNVTLSLDVELYRRLKDFCADMGVPISHVVSKLCIDMLNVKAEGSTASHVDYERLKREHTRLLNEALKIKKALKRGRVFKELAELAENVGVDFKTLDNLQALEPKLLSRWDGLPHYMHEFITMLETIRKMKSVEAKLSQIRSAEKSHV